MIGEGIGCFKKLVAEWKKFQAVTSNMSVIQNKTMSGIASMRIRGGKWEIELGE